MAKEKVLPWRRNPWEEDQDKAPLACPDPFNPVVKDP
jgi:hypothetical protein